MTFTNIELDLFYISEIDNVVSNIIFYIFIFVHCAQFCSNSSSIHNNNNVLSYTVAVTEQIDV